MGPRPKGAAVTPEIAASRKVTPFTITEHCSNAGAAFHSASLTINHILDAFSEAL
jgi:hypothetical protein